jgi:hypothetical protein
VLTVGMAVARALKRARVGMVKRILDCNADVGCGELV